MKSVIKSLRPEVCMRIANGEQSIIVAKSAPKEVPFKAYMYQTKHKCGCKIINEVLDGVYNSGKVIGSFVCDRIREIIPLGLRGFKLGAEWLKEMCLSKEQLDEYGGLKTLYSWHITEPKLFDKPRALSEFGIARAPMSWCYVEQAP